MDDVESRLLNRIAIHPVTGCFEWQGAVSTGYGRIKVTEGERKVTRLTHRVAYERWIGPIPDGHVLDHLCKNTPCCNPLHLEPVMQRENLRRAPETSAALAEYRAREAGKTHCPRGHAYSEENTYVLKSKRHCKTCGRDKSRRQWREKNWGAV